MRLSAWEPSRRRGRAAGEEECGRGGREQEDEGDRAGVDSAWVASPGVQPGSEGDPDDRGAQRAAELSDGVVGRARHARHHVR